MTAGISFVLGVLGGHVWFDRGGGDDGASAREAPAAAPIGRAAESGWDAREAASAIAAIARAEPDFWVLEEKTLAALAGLGPGRVRDVYRELEETLPGGRYRRVRDATLKLWVALDPGSAYRHFSGVGMAGAGPAVSDLFRSWGASDPEGALAAARRHMPGRGAPWLSFAFQGLGGSDPERAIALLEVLAYEPFAEAEMTTPYPAVSGGIRRSGERPPGSFIVRALCIVLDSWARRDPAAAARALEGAEAGLLGGKTASFGYYNVAFNWALRDPDAALAWAAGLAGNGLRESATEAVFSALKDNDPARAAGVLELLPDGKARHAHLSALARSWYPLDPSAALAWIGENLSGKTRHSIFEDLLRNGAIRGDADPAAAAAFALSLPPRSKTSDPVSTAAKTWAANDRGVALAWAEGIENPQRQLAALKGVLDSWTREDAAAAARYLDRRGGALRDDSARTVASTWAMYAPVEAAAWAEGLPANEVRSAALGTIVKSWSLYDLPAAAAYVAGRPDDGANKSLAKHVAATMAREDPVAALGWAADLPAPEARSEALRQALTSWSYRDPGAVAAVLFDHVSGEDAAAVARSVIPAWTKGDPAAAANWAEEYPDEGQRHQLAADVAQAWSRFELAAPLAWADGLDTPSRDAAVKALIRPVTASSPARAYTWATSIEEAELRAGAIRDVIYRWKNLDPARAREAAEQAPVDAGQRERLLRIFR